MTMPLLQKLRRNLRDAWISLGVRPQVYNAVELCPYVNGVLIYDLNTLGHMWQLRWHGKALRVE